MYSQSVSAAHTRALKLTLCIMCIDPINDVIIYTLSPVNQRLGLGSRDQQEPIRGWNPGHVTNIHYVQPIRDRDLGHVITQLDN